MLKRSTFDARLSVGIAALGLILGLILHSPATIYGGAALSVAARVDLTLVPAVTELIYALRVKSWTAVRASVLARALVDSILMAVALVLLYSSGGFQVNALAVLGMLLFVAVLVDLGWNTASGWIQAATDAEAAEAALDPSEQDGGRHRA